MNKKLFYEQPQTAVLKILFEGQILQSSHDQPGEQQDLGDWTGN